MDPLAILIVMTAAMALGAVAAVIGRFVARREPTLLVPVALAVATCAALVQQEGWPTRAPAGGTLALTPMWASIVLVASALALATIVDVLAPRVWRESRARPLIIAVVSAAIVGALLRLPRADSVGVAYLAAGATFVLVVATRTLAARHRGFGWIAAISFACASTAALVLHSGFAKAGVVAGAASAALGAVALVSWRTRTGLGHAANATALALLASFAALGRAYADDARPLFPAWIWLIPVAAPLAAWVAEAPALARRPRLASVVRWAAPLTLAFGAVGLAFVVGAPAEPANPYAP
ncbi:MAG: hypothetical protein SGJ09_09040 [Phycisphaerae bacterium]|nr:hypothetical protein [Phycisphaerae bacterium]